MNKSSTYRDPATPEPPEPERIDFSWSRPFLKLAELPRILFNLGLEAGFLILSYSGPFFVFCFTALGD